MVQADVNTKEFILPDEGVYDATYSGTEEIESTYGIAWRWAFEITANDKTIEVSGVTSPNFGRNTKAYRWACAIAGKKYKEGDKIDTDTLIGKKCTITIAHKVTNDGTVFPNVTEVIKHK